MTNCPLPSVQLIALELSSTFIVPATTIGLVGGLTTTSLVCDSQVPLSIPTTKVVVVVRDGGGGVILKLYTVPVGAGATEAAVVQLVVVPKLVRVPSGPFSYKTKPVGVPVVTLILSSTAPPDEQRFITLSPCAEASMLGGVPGTCGVTERVHTGPDGLVL